MLVYSRLRHPPRNLPRHVAPHYRTVSPTGRRYFIREVGDGFLDLALALPFPTTFPPYSSTIILVTVLLRAALLPVAVWGKRRAIRVEDFVVPELQKMKPVVAKSVFEQMQKERVRGDKEFLQKEHAKRCTEVLKAHRKQLCIQHKCRPLPSMIVPPLSQIPPFILMSAVLANLSSNPASGFDSEAFLTLTTLAHPDPTMMLPIFVGLITMANVEASSWVMNAAEKEQIRQLEEQRSQMRDAKGNPVRTIRPASLVKGGMRVLSVVRIIFTAIAPGSVAIYWVTSATFGLLQTWLMEWLDLRRKRMKALSGPEPAIPHAAVSKPGPRPLEVIGEPLPSVHTQKKKTSPQKRSGKIQK